MPTPNGAPGAPQAMPPQAQPGGGQTPSEGQGQKAVEMIKKGFQDLGKLIQSAGQNLDPQDIKLFQSAVQATDLLIQTLTSPQDESKGQPKPTSRPPGPMPINANAKAQPV